MKILLTIFLVFTAISAVRFKKANHMRQCGTETADVVVEEEPMCACNNPGEGNQNALNGMDCSDGDDEWTDYCEGWS